MRLPTAALPAGAWLWLTLLVAAPLALSQGSMPVATLAMYRSASLLCHQKAERSFAVADVQMPVCARCLGLYVAGALGALAHLAARRPQRSAPPTARVRVVLAAAALPMLLSVGLEWTGAIEGSNISRFLSALPLGVAAGWLLQRLVASDGARLVGSYG